MSGKVMQDLVRAWPWQAVRVEARNLGERSNSGSEDPLDHFASEVDMITSLTKMISANLVELQANTVTLWAKGIDDEEA
jgi:phage-related minor tail protein